jgi:hypothetical protein
MSKLGALVAGVLALCAMAVAVNIWLSLGDVDMSFGGYLALIAGGIATLGLGIALMGLVFYSHRKGFDERAGEAARHTENGTPSVEIDRRDG